MHRLPTRVALWLAALLAAAPAQRDPHIGFVYPAGGQRGAEFEAVVGGQYLDGVSGVRVSGEGVEATVLEHTKPFTPQQSNELRQKLRELENRLQAAGKGGGKRGERGGSATIKEIARELGLDVADRKGIDELRKKLFNPLAQLNPQLGETVRVRIALAAGAGPGVREVRLMTPVGASNPIAFHIGQLPELRENERNDPAADGGEAPGLPVIINGQIMPGDVDRFRFTARKGARLVIAACARGLVPYMADAVPGWFQATLALRDANGREVAYSDDYRFQPDPVLCYEVPADGPYTLEIKDAIYRGREDFVYRIAVGELPFITSIFPLGGRVGALTVVELEGWNLPVPALTLGAGENSAPAILPVALCRDGEIPGGVSFALDTLPESREQEPNDEPEKAQPIGLPLIVNGRIGAPGDRDVFRFEGRAGDEIIAEVQARRLGSPLDSLLVAADAAGRVLASNDDHEDKGSGLVTHHADSELRLTVPADGACFLRLVDTQRKGGAAYGYRLRVSRPRPDFALRVVPSTINARAGTTVPIAVHALRKDGFAGDIALELVGAPPGFALSGGWVPAKEREVRLTLTVPPAPTKDPVTLRLEGYAGFEGRDVRRPAVPAEDMMQAFSYHHLVPSQEWVVTVTGGGRPGAGLRLLDETVVRISPGGTARVRVAAPRGLRAAQVRLELREPPKGIAIEDVSTVREGLAITLRAEAGKAEPGLKGNLIVEAFVERDPPKGAEGGKKAGPRRLSLGTLPAIPFAVASP